MPTTFPQRSSCPTSQHAYPAIGQIFSRLLEDNAHQPATLLFRTAEIAHLVRSGLFPANGEVLDMGCGDGHISQLLEQFITGTRRWTGVDIDEEELRLAAKRSFYERVLTTDSAVTSLPANSFDVAFSNSVLEHVHDLGPVLEVVARTVRPGGKFMFTVPSEYFEESIDSPSALRRSLLGVKDREEYIAQLNKRIAHFRYLSPVEWDELLGPLGFKRQHVSYYLDRPQTNRWMLVADFTSGILARLAGKRPIEVQRSLGIRTGRASLPMRILGTVIARFAAWNRFDSVTGQVRNGACALYVYEKVRQ